MLQMEQKEKKQKINTYILKKLNNIIKTIVFQIQKSNQKMVGGKQFF